MTIVEAGRLLRSREITSVELTNTCLLGIGQGSRLNAFITVCDQYALEQARQMDIELSNGYDRGPLHGIPIALKDVFQTQGIRTTCGSKLFAENIPAEDCEVWQRLKKAGGVLVGKTGMHELAYGVTSNNPHFGTIRNPWNADHIPGGSSGGSGVAAATGMAFAAMGSDTGGSIRIPAAYCGTVGLKPTYGRVSRDGVMPLDFSLDHMGPLTRSVKDAAIVLQAIAGHDVKDHTSSTANVPDYQFGLDAPLAGLRLGIPKNYYFEQAGKSIADSVHDAAKSAEKLGAKLVSVQVPNVEHLNAVGRVILLVEASATLEPYLHRREEFGTDVIALLDQGRFLAGTEYVQAQRIRRMFQLSFQRLWEEVDCLLTPTTPNVAPKIGQTEVSINGRIEDERLAATKFVRGINVLGLPALSLPCGLSEGLPIGLQLIGKPFDEATILRLGYALESQAGCVVNLVGL